MHHRGNREHNGSMALFSRHLIKSVIGTDIEIAGRICRQTLDGIAVQSRNLGEVR